MLCNILIKKAEIVIVFSEIEIKNNIYLGIVRGKNILRRTDIMNICNIIISQTSVKRQVGMNIII